MQGETHQIKQKREEDNFEHPLAHDGINGSHDGRRYGSGTPEKHVCEWLLVVVASWGREAMDRPRMEGQRKL